MRPCLSQATTLTTPFAEDVVAAAGSGCPTVEVWLTKLETHLESHSVVETRKFVDEKGVALVAAAYQGGLLLSRGEQRSAHVGHFRRRLDLCQSLGIGTLVLAPDAVMKPDAALFPRAVAGLAEAARWAAGFAVTLALEFRPGAICTCLDTAVSLVEACEEPNVGVCLDVFHYNAGPSKPEDLVRLTRENLAHVQVCDVAGIPRELMGDSDRIFPGEGDFPLDPIVARLRKIGYRGFVSLELMNPTIWKAKPAGVAELGSAALHRLISGNAPPR